MPARPELVFALVGPIGSDLDAVESLLREALGEFGYKSETIRLSGLLDSLDVWSDGTPPAKELPEDERITAYMDAARNARERSGHNDILVLQAMLRFIRLRNQKRHSSGWSPPKLKCPKCDHAFETWVGPPPLRETAFILHSLKHPEEVRTLQRVYGPGFFLIGVFSSEEERKSVLMDKIRETRNRLNSPLKEKQLSEVATKLMNRDIAEEGAASGQRVKDAFHLADLFISIGGESGRQQAESELSRFLDLLFSYPFSTPRKDEYGMFLAHVAATRSSSLARQVGAALANKDGEILALGANEMARPGGGLIWDDDSKEVRNSDREEGKDTGALMKDRAASEAWRCACGLVSEAAKELRDRALAKRIEEVVSGIPEDKAIEKLHSTPTLGNVIEFYREVHAEMAAVVEASRRGVAVDGAIAYVTTFPCHDCAKHLVAAGVRRVVYIEPYPKSRASEFYPNVFDPERNRTLDDSQRVSVEPFVGIGPRCYRRLFTLATAEGSVIRRRDSRGSKMPWTPDQAGLRWRTWSESYLEYELMLVRDYRLALDEAGLRGID